MKVKAKHKYGLIGFVYLFGLICASFLDSIPCFVFFGVIGVIFGLALEKSSLFFRINLAFLGAAFLVMGLYRAAYIDSGRSLIGGKYKVSGIVTECRAPDNDTVGITVKGMANGKSIKFTLFTPDYGVSRGDRIELEAVFSDFSDSAEFSESSYYFSKGIFLKAYGVSDITVTGHTKTISGYIADLSEYFRYRVDRLFSGSGGGIIKAMFFGDKTGLSYDVRADITHSGISHLTAVSGMHLSLLVHMFAGVISFFFRKGGKGYFFAVTGCILFLMVFFGMTASVMRSGFMMIVYYGSSLLRRRTNTVSSVGCALLVILLLNPYACRDIGLMLSVAGTIGVGAVSPMAAKYFRVKSGTLFSSTVLPSVCASLCTMPIGAFCFGGISFAAPVTCLLVQPFFTVILLIVPVAVTFSFLSEPLLFIAAWAGEIMKAIAHFVSGFSFSYAEVDGDIMFLFMVIIVSGGALTAFIMRKIKPVAVFAAVITLAFAASVSLYDIISFDDIVVSIEPCGGQPVVCVRDKTGESFYMLSSGKKTAGIVYGKLSGEKANLICIGGEATGRTELSSLSRNVHFPENMGMEYKLSGDYEVLVNDGGILLKIRGITIGIFPAGSEQKCDIPIYCGYKENYGTDGKIATILCHKKYYNCGEAVNAFLNKTEIVINSEGKYALCVKNKGG